MSYSNICEPLVHVQTLLPPDASAARQQTAEPEPERRAKKPKVAKVVWFKRK